MFFFLKATSMGCVHYKHKVFKYLTVKRADFWENVAWLRIHVHFMSDDSVSDIWGSSVLLHWTDLVELAPIWTQNFAFCGLIQKKSQDASLQTSLWTIMTFLLCTIDAQFSTLTDIPQRLWMARLARYMALYKSYILLLLCPSVTQFSTGYRFF